MSKWTQAQREKATLDWLSMRHPNEVIGPFEFQKWVRSGNDVSGDIAIELACQRNELLETAGKLAKMCMGTFSEDGMWPELHAQAKLVEAAIAHAESK